MSHDDEPRDATSVARNRALSILPCSKNASLSPIQARSAGKVTIPAKPPHMSASVWASSEFDAVDQVLFETLQWIADQEKAFTLWSEPARAYRVTELPVYFIRRDDGGAPVKAYLLNFPSPPAEAIEVVHGFPDVGRVHRYDAEIGELWPAAQFEFALDLSGRRTYAIAYSRRDMDRTPQTHTGIPFCALDVWVSMFVHEGFHHYQFYGPASDWLDLSWGGLPPNYPRTAGNVGLYILEKRALLAGRNSATAAEKVEVLRRVLAVRHTRAQLPEATGNTSPITATVKTHGQGTRAPDGIGQSFTARETGELQSVWIDVLHLDDAVARLELQTGTDSWPGSYRQVVTLSPGRNTISLDVPFPVELGLIYSFGVFPRSGFLGLWSGADSYAGGEAFFIVNAKRVGITPPPDLVFGVTSKGPNYVDRMDRYQERNEGSAQHVARRLFVLSGSTIYARELLEQLERTTWTHYQTSRDELMRTMFQGGWYETGSTLLDLINEVTNINWRTGFPSGDSPIGLVETLYGPLPQPEIDRLVDEAKQAYDWNAIMKQVGAIPPDYLDPIP